MFDSASSRRQWFSQLACLGATAALPRSTLAWPAAGAQDLGGGQPPLRIAVGARGTLYHLPLLVAQELDYFAQEKLAVRIVDFSAGAQAVQALASGAVDVCCGAYEHVVRGQLQGRDWRSLALLARAPQIALMAPAHLRLDADPGRLATLRIGVTAPGSSTHYLARLWLQGAGIPADAAQFVAVGVGTTALDALRQGRIHALCHADPLLTLLEQRSRVTVLADTRSLKGTAQVYGGPMPGGCLFAAQTFIQSQPEQAQALANAMVRALRWLQTASPADLAQIVPKAYLLGDRGAYLAAFEKVRETLSPDGLMPADGPVTALRAVQRMRPEASQQARVALERTFSNTWAHRARAKLERV